MDTKWLFFSGFLSWLDLLLMPALHPALFSHLWRPYQWPLDSFFLVQASLPLIPFIIYYLKAYTEREVLGFFLDCYFYDGLTATFFLAVRLWLRNAWELRF